MVCRARWILPYLLLILCPWALFHGCLHPPASPGEDRTFKGQLTLYLEAEKEGTPLSFTLQGMEARREKGEWVPLPDCRGRFSAQELGEGGAFLWEGWLPEGGYTSLRLTIVEAHLREGGGEVPLKIGGDNLYPFEFTLQPRRNTTLFLRWDPEGSLQEGLLFRPRIEPLIKRNLPAQSSFLYVTNQGGGNVTLIDRIKGEVLGTILVGRQPRGIAVSPNRSRVYVANFGSGTVSVVDPRIRELVNDLRLQQGSEPVDLAVSSKGSPLYLVNRFSANLLILDGLGGGLEESLPLGRAPGQILLFSSAGEERAFITFPDGNVVCVVDLSSKRVIATLTAGTAPQGMALDARRRRLFVSSRRGGGISVIDLDQLRVERSLSVWGSLGRMAFDPLRGKLYVVDEEGGAVLVVAPEVGMVTSRIQLEGKPIDIGIDPQLRKAYVLCQEGRLVILDMISHKKLLRLPVGRDPQRIGLPSLEGF